MQFMMFKIATGPDSTASKNQQDFLIVESCERGDLLTPLKLQKLMFYSDAWFVALHDEELTNEYPS
ncbi:Panacea domain-containing protein [Octadecabacter antarcticus]|nr:hypothetical protein [Octadecabacter antarcticus]